MVFASDYSFYRTLGYIVAKGVFRLKQLLVRMFLRWEGCCQIDFLRGENRGNGRYCALGNSQGPTYNYAYSLRGILVGTLLSSVLYSNKSDSYNFLGGKSHSAFGILQITFR